MGFLKNESLKLIVDAPRNCNSFNFTLNNAQSMPISESGLLVKFFIAAKFNHTISSGWPLLQIRRIQTKVNEMNGSSDSSYFSQVFSTTMEPIPTGYLNVFEYDVQNMSFNIQQDDIIRVFWPEDTIKVSRRYSLAYFRDSSNVMLSIEINKNESSKPLDNDDFTTNSDSSYDTISTKVPETSTKAQTQVTIIIGSVLCALAVIILLVVLIIAVFVVLQCRNHTKDFSPNTSDLKILPPVLDNPTYSLVDGEFYNKYHG